MFNLVHEAWIPVMRKSGERESIRPTELVDNYTHDPIIALDAQRPDFNGALIQFLIGLVQTTCPPINDREWRKKFSEPPSSNDLKSSFERYTDAFNLDGEGARFMQDLNLSEKEGKPNQIDQLLMEMPGEKTIEDNTDHFQKAGTVKQICLRCCAMALFTLQTNAPLGGRGHRTSVRGGGPLTTVVVGRTLWETVWLNVLNAETFSTYGNSGKMSLPDLFPWMGPTRTSEPKGPEKKGQETTSQHVNPVQMFWGMPRRIRLVYESSEKQSPCDLCGDLSTQYLTKYLDKGHGNNYRDWHHVLTPYSVDEETETRWPKLMRPGDISYRNWTGLVQNSFENKSRTEPAVVVHTFWNERQDKLPENNRIPYRLWTFGYHTNQNTAMGWYEGTMPLIHIDPGIRPEYEAIVGRMVKTARLIASNVRKCIKKALFDPKAKISGDLWSVDSQFWQNTESSFYQVMNELKTTLETRQETTPLKLRWLGILSNEGEILFDRYSQSNLISVADPERIATGHRDLMRYCSPYNKLIIQLLDLKKTEGEQK